LCANGFRDTTRIASGSPEMWRDIALANGLRIDRALGAFINDLNRVRSALRSRNQAALSKFLENAKQRRDRWAASAKSHSPE
ncbi:MAG TPA: prephenate dehydrogenase dimerization domain-containing protein, partial [Methylomirabilota bacterium]|nr:prephenate dehydrogenase dimerization domain-containing protein [Methylomirabilota bacterium]